MSENSLIQMNYVTYSKNKKSNFYENDNLSNNMKENFEIYEYNQKQWIVKNDSEWVYMLYNPSDLPEQGWKIHLTTEISEASLMLFKVSKYLIEKKISFKYVSNVKKLIQKNSKYAERSSSGKFITIYPQAESDFIELLEKLKELTDEFENGPYILNDQQWKLSNVFFRYGGFKKMVTNINGEKVDAIKDPDGKLIEDKRVPYYYLPKFVTEPSYILENNVFSNSKEFKKLKTFNIKESLHFSDAGGVYLANREGNSLVLKEGRTKSGLDAKGLDGFTRNRKEYLYLKKLKDVDEVINVGEYFVAWEHNYFTEEFVEGKTIENYIATSFPFSNVSDDEIDKYIRQSKNIIYTLIKTIKKIHKLDVAMGDLHPSNVLIKKNNKIILIDFESASSKQDLYFPGLTTPGFVSSESKTFEQADWFALYKISRYLFLPIEPVSDMAPQLTYVQDKIIKEKFGQELLNYLNEIKLECGRHVSLQPTSVFLEEKLNIPSEELKESSVFEFKSNLRRGIENNLSFSSFNLIKGDVKQYRNLLSKYNVATGAFGTIMALVRTNGEENDDFDIEIRKWIDNIIPNVMEINDKSESLLDYGLFSGLSGVSTVLFELGLDEYSEKILNKICKLTVNKDVNMNDISISNGLSGIGLLLYSFYENNKDSKIKKSMAIIAEKILYLYKQNTSEKIADTGFLTGWAGAALYFLKISEISNFMKYKKYGIKIMDEIIGTLYGTEAGQLMTVDKSRGFDRLIPYLENGTIGLIIVMIEFYINDSSFFNLKRRKVFNNLIEMGTTYCTYMAGLISGYTGFLVLGNALNSVFNKKEILNNSLKSLNAFLIKDNDGNLLLPGNYGFKCSMDIETGSAGLLLVLNDVKKDKWGSWFPVISGKDRGMFSK